MALDSKSHLIHSNNNNSSLYTFCRSSSSSDHNQTQLGLSSSSSSSSQLGFHHKLAKDNTNQYIDHMKLGRVSKVLYDSNDGSLISFDESYEAVAGGDRVYDEFFDDSHHQASKVNHRDDHEMLDCWFHSSNVVDHLKHPGMDESCMPPNKKQCTTSSATANKKSSKAKQPAVESKDPQSIAAKNRRERISERLKILQELVPNGTKVDLVTMLEKAIGYVKFLQLQVKVLAADEFWPVQGGKAPELSQVKDAIDAILSSQRSDTNVTSD